MSKTLIGLTVVSIIIQILFSFYYSSNIVNQNNQLDENKQKYQQLILDTAQIKKQLISLTSIEYFLQSTPSASLSQNFKSVDISQF